MRLFFSLSLVCVRVHCSKIVRTWIMFMVVSRMISMQSTLLQYLSTENNGTKEGKQREPDQIEMEIWHTAENNTKFGWDANKNIGFR